ncbi:hypothetical protein MGU_09428 [Metarhizium guizhouense ARSEF 977]|uniref:2EXR domain-containing protein n=1 Tax=Metarhizium guizhouense (strain ARSEF 977) TaxID=1276136 RepID=A0A0B4GL05_METGA|nr:hypothetical protein MGU_09428 [Metarhizium guizhouense ARSEF 977]
MTPDLPKACFDVLPAEIRLYIWSLCLPDRTVEFVVKHRDDKPADDKPTVPNWVWEDRVHHADPPSWYKVTKESYEVASKHGFTNKKPDKLSDIANPCAPPDKWLISWDLKTKGRENFTYSPLDDFFKVVEDKISESRSKAAQPAPLISYQKAYDTNQLYLIWDQPERRETPITFPTNLLPEFGIKFWSPESWKELENTVHNRYDLLAMAKNYQRTDKWASFTITLHGKRRRKLAPGLFGEFGENPVLFVHLYDEKTAWQLQELYKMWQNESPAHDDRTESIFEYLFCRPDDMPERWAKILLDRFIIATWAEDRARGVVDAKGAWSPDVPDEELPVVQEHRLVTTNTWGIRVVSELRAQPETRNYAVFRACYRGHCWEPSNGGE